jgi:hypothetical protein
MNILVRLTRVMIFAPVALLGFFYVPTANADVVESGLTVTVYNNFGYNGAPPLPAISGRPSVGEMTVSRVQQNFDQEPPFGMYEDFIVQYEGYITSPVSGTFRLWPQADDGTKLYIDDLLVQNDWRDKGGGGEFSSYVTFEAGVSKKFEMWFYENGGGAWTTLYWDIGNGWEIVPDNAFTKQVAETTTTTIAPYLNNPQNLVVTSTNESKVYLSWDLPEQSNVEVERYAVFYSCDNWSSGFGIASLTTTAVIEGLDPEQSCQFKVRADNDSLSVYSGWSNEVNGVTTPTTTTTLPPVSYSLNNAVWETANEGSELTLSAPRGNVFTEVLFASYGTPFGSSGSYYASECNSSSSIQEVSAVFIGNNSSSISADNGVFGDPCGGTYKHLTVVLKYSPLATNTTITETTTTSVFTFPTLAPADTEEPVETSPSQSDTESTEPVTSVPQYAEEQTPAAEEPQVDSIAEAAVAELDTTEVSATELADAVSEILTDVEGAEELGSLVNDILDKPLTDEQFASVIDEVLSEPLSVEELSAVLDAVFDEPISDEKFDSVIDAVLDQPLSDEQFAEVVNILESENITEEQVASAVDSVLENGVTEDQATELATSAKVLESIDGEQATEIFAAVDISAVTEEEAAELVEAVQDAPTEVREALESEVNIFQGAIDTYVPLGSSVPISTRRAIIGVTAVLTMLPAPTPRRI